MKQEVVVTIDLDTGKVVIEAEGYMDNACHLDVEALAKATGTTTLHKSKKPVRDEVQRLKTGK